MPYQYTGDNITKLLEEKGISVLGSKEIQDDKGLLTAGWLKKAGAVAEGSPEYDAETHGFAFNYVKQNELQADPTILQRAILRYLLSIELRKTTDNKLTQPSRIRFAMPIHVVENHWLYAEGVFEFSVSGAENLVANESIKASLVTLKSQIQKSEPINLDGAIDRLLQINTVKEELKKNCKKMAIATVDSLKDSDQGVYNENQSKWRANLEQQLASQFGTDKVKVTPYLKSIKQSSSSNDCGPLCVEGIASHLSSEGHLNDVFLRQHLDRFKTTAKTIREKINPQNHKEFDNLTREIDQFLKKEIKKEESEKYNEDLARLWGKVKRFEHSLIVDFKEQEDPTSVTGNTKEDPGGKKEKDWNRIAFKADLQKFIADHKMKLEEDSQSKSFLLRYKDDEKQEKGEIKIDEDGAITMICPKDLKDDDPAVIAQAKETLDLYIMRNPDAKETPTITGPRKAVFDKLLAEDPKYSAQFKKEEEKKGKSKSPTQEELKKNLDAIKAKDKDKENLGQNGPPPTATKFPN